MSEDLSTIKGSQKFNQKDIRLIRFMYRKGATDKEVASELGVHENTLNKWKKRNSAFFEKIKEWKEEADAKVEKKLYERALGYDVSEEKAFHDKASGSIVKCEVRKHIPADVTAIIFWLKNRKPKEWRDKQEIDVSDKGKPMTITLAYKTEKAE